jgi:phosphoglucosamine mutase
MFEYALAAGITASGADACLLHVTTTPSVAYIAKVDSFDCGIMISASHNPYYDNGIKLIDSNGEKMEDDVIDKIEEYLDGAVGEIPYSTRGNIGRTVDYVAGRNRYVGYLISVGLYSFKGYKVALDCANGASWNIAKAVSDALGAKTYAINAEPDGLNINRDAGSTHIENLCKYVVDNGMNVGFAYDGDADRCLCVDENGKVVDGDKILYIYARYLKEQGELTNNTVVATVMSNLGFFKALDEIGIDYAKTAVGDKNVHDYMAEHNNCIGGEQSGHIIFSQYASTGDGILTSLKMMEVMIAKKSTLSKLAEPVVIYPQALVNVRVREEDKNKIMEDSAVLEAVKRAEEELCDEGRILLRKSGTEPLIRVMAEAADDYTCHKCIKMITDVIEELGYALK